MTRCRQALIETRTVCARLGDHHGPRRYAYHPHRMAVRTKCFLCDPNPFAGVSRRGPLLAILGLGPIGEGYSLMATREHVPSMMDLMPRETRELEAFTERVRTRLRPMLGPA